MGKECVPSVQDPGDGVDLVGPQVDLRVHAGKGQVAAVKLPGSRTVEPFIVHGGQPVPAIRVLPKPVPKGLLDLSLLLLGQDGLLHVQHPLLPAFLVYYGVVYPHILQVQAVLNDVVGIDPLRAVGHVGRHIVRVAVLSFDPPFAAYVGVPYLDIPLSAPTGLQKLEDERLYILFRNPGRAQPDADFGCGQVLGLYLLQGGYGHGQGVGQLVLARCPKLFLYGSVGGQLPTHVPGQKLVRRNERELLEIEEIRAVKARIPGPYIPEHQAGQFRFQFLLGLAGQLGHVGQVRLRLLGEGNGQRLRRRVHMGDLGAGADGPLGEHIRLSLQLTVLIQNLQRTKQGVRGIVRKRHAVAPAVQQTVLGCIGVVEGIQLPLGVRDGGVREVVQLSAHELMDAVPDDDHAPDAVLGRQGDLDLGHDGVFPEIDLPVHDGIREVPHIGVGGQRSLRRPLQGVLLFVGYDLSVDVGHGVPELFREIGSLDGVDRLAHAEAGAFLRQFAQDHVGILQEILVDRIPQFGLAHMEPILVHLHGVVPLLQEEDVRHHIRPGVGAKGVVGQPDSAEKLRTLGQVLPDGGIRLVHGPAGGDEGHHAAGTHLVQRFCKKVIMYEKVVFVIPLVRHAVIAEGHVADGHIEEAIGEHGVLKPVDLDVGVLIQLLCDPAGQVVQLHAVELAARHALGQHTEEVADPAGGLQDVPCAEAHAFNGLVHGSDDGGRGVMGVQGGRPRGAVLLRRQQLLQFGVLLAPLGLGFVEGVRQSAPANVLGQDLLLLRCRQPVLGFDLLQGSDGGHVPLELGLCAALAQMIVRDAIIDPFIRYRLNRLRLRLGRLSLPRRAKVDYYAVEFNFFGSRFRNGLLFCSLCTFLFGSVRILRVGDHGREIQGFQILVQLRQRIRLHLPDHPIVDPVDDAVLLQVSEYADLVGVRLVRGIRKTYMGQIGEVGIRSELGLTIGIDQPFSPIEIIFFNGLRHRLPLLPEQGVLSRTESCQLPDSVLTVLIVTVIRQRSLCQQGELAGDGSYLNGVAQ